MDPYASLSEAATYFSERLRTAPWDDASQDDKLKALKMATRAIDRLNFAGYKHDAAQEFQFPRGDDTVVPQDVKDACCELAITFLDDVDADMEVENLSNSQQGIGDAKTSRDTSYVQLHIRAGIPSIKAWSLLTPYLDDPRNVDVSRG